MFASLPSGVNTPLPAGVLFLIQSATSLSQGFPKLSDILRSSSGNALLRKKLLEKIISGTITRYSNLCECKDLIKFEIKNAQPRITPGGNNVIKNLSPFDGNNS